MDLLVIGGGLAGCEAALAAANNNMRVGLWEMKPQTLTPAASQPWLAELVCSNSLRSSQPSSAVGMLKQEMSLLGSQVIKAALKHQVAAGQALAVDRQAFAQHLDDMVSNHHNIQRECRVVHSLDELPEKVLCILATGPLTHSVLAESLAGLSGQHLHFYDAIAPIVVADSVDMDLAFWGDRYGEPEQGDYLNCPMNREEWEVFYNALMSAPKVALHDFEEAKYFEGCLPLEVMAERGPQTLLFGPMKPVGFTDSRSGRRPYALLQLRKEDAHGQLFNMVGCQTKLTHNAQLQVFRLIPALRQAQFSRLGSIHRNAFIDAPATLGADLRLLARPNIMVAGQLAGVEGYVESAACGLWAGWNAIRFHNNLPALSFPATTAFGGLAAHLANKTTINFQPSNITWGLLPPLGPPPPPARKWPKKEKHLALARRALHDFTSWMREQGLQPAEPLNPSGF